MFKELWNFLGFDYSFSTKEKQNESIFDFIVEERSREGHKNFYGKLNLKGIPYLQFAILNRDIDDEHVKNLYEISKQKYENTASIYYDGEIVLAVFNNEKEIYGIVIDGQHRIKAIEKLVDDGIIPCNFMINVIVHRITSFNDGFNLIKRWNKDVTITFDQEFSNQLLNELQQLQDENNIIFGKIRPKVDTAKFIVKIRQLELGRKYSILELKNKLLEYNNSLKKDIKKCLQGEITIQNLQQKYGIKGLSTKKLEKYDKSKFCLGIDNEYNYLEKY